MPANELKGQMKLEKISAKGNAHDLRKSYKNATPPIPTKGKHSKLIKGCAGLPAGLMKTIWRRGYADTSESKLPNYKECLEIAKKTHAFANELSELEINMKKVDVEVIFTPKGHCEISTGGMECLWGVSKAFFLRQNAELHNDKRVNDLNPRIEKIFSNMSLDVIQNDVEELQNMSCHALN